METKKCNTCGEEKPLKAFYKNKSTGYYLSHCNPCRKSNQRKYNKQYWEKNKEYLKTADWRKPANDRWKYKEPGAVYMIRNLITGQCYIGETKEPNNRRGNHFSLHKRKNGEYSIPKLYNDMEKYGKDNFVFGVIEYTEDHKEKEQYYINKFKPYYNA